MNYCTLFNSHYLSRGLALYYSLLKNVPHFHLYIFAFDEAAFQILSIMDLKFVTLIPLKNFETPALLQAKKDRTIAEYCWTCTSATVLYCLEQYHLQEVCYLDADLFFWQDPIVLLDEAKSASILITEHRYTPIYDHSQVSGKYCVQFMYFKNDTDGLKALRWWRDACLDWCYNRVEPGRFGDQKYLDDWLQRFKNVKVLTHLGGGVAPWNVQQYEIHALTLDQKILLREKTSGYIFDLIFYHFHALRFVNNKIDFGTYKLSPKVIKEIYYPYVNELLRIEQLLKSNKQLYTLIEKINFHCKLIKSFSLVEWAKNIKKKITGTHNIFSVTNFKR